MGAASRRGIVLAVLSVAAALAVPATAGAATVAYIDNGEVWLSSLDGTQKTRLASPVVNSDGDTEKWLDVAHSDGGRIVAVRNKPGRMSSFSWFKVWEPDGSSTIEGSLGAPSGWSTYTYPLGFDITADGQHLVYGFSNSGSCCPITFSTGTYVRLIASGTLEPIKLSLPTEPGMLGNRIVALENSSSPNIVLTQNVTSGNPYNDEFTPWLDTSGTGMDANQVEIAANGQLAALGFEVWDSGTWTVGKIAVLSTAGVDALPTGPVDCFVPATGIARDASLSQDATTIAWKDDGGLQVAGVPTTAADPCVMGSGPVVISPTGEFPSIGGADITRFLPPATTPPPTTGPPAATPGPAPAVAPVLRLPAKLTAKALASAKGAAVGVQVGGPGKVTVTGKVPAKALGRSGKPIVVATGRATATAAGRVTVRLRLTKAARKRAKRLKGAKLSLRVVHGGRSSTKSITLR